MFFIDVFQLFDGNAGFFFHVRQLGLFFEDGVAEAVECVAPDPAFGDFFFYPFQVGDFGQEVLDEVVAFHMDAVKADVADFAFKLADVFDTAAKVAAEAFDLAGGEADFQELVGDGVAVCQIIGGGGCRVFPAF